MTMITPNHALVQSISYGSREWLRSSRQPFNPTQLLADVVGEIRTTLDNQAREQSNGRVSGALLTNISPTIYQTDLGYALTVAVIGEWELTLREAQRVEAQQAQDAAAAQAARAAADAELADPALNAGWPSCDSYPQQG